MQVLKNEKETEYQTSQLPKPCLENKVSMNNCASLGTFQLTFLEISRKSEKHVVEKWPISCTTLQKTNACATGQLQWHFFNVATE